MKKVISLVMALVMAAGTMVITSCGRRTDIDDIIKIGVFEPASGDNSAGGKQETLGIQYANSVQDTIELGEKKYKVELVIVDNESSEDKAPMAAKELIDKGSSVVLGSYGSGASIAAADIFKNSEVSAIGITCTNPEVTKENSHYFRICFLDPFQGRALVSFAKDNFKASKAYVLAKQDDDYSAGLSDYFAEEFKAAGGEVVLETFSADNTDFSSYITKAKNEGADVFFAPVSTEAAALIINAAADGDLNIPIMAGDTWDSNVILNAAKGRDVEIYVSTFYHEGVDAEFDKGIKAWINADGARLMSNGGDDKIAAVTAMGYDAYFTALEAIKLAGSPKPAAIGEALKSVNYNGVSGNIQFDENGDAKGSAVYVKIVNTGTGNWDFVAEHSIAE